MIGMRTSAEAMFELSESNGNRPRWGFDIDGVLYQWQDYVYAILLFAKQTNMPYRDFWANRHLYQQQIDILSHCPELYCVKPADALTVGVLNEIASFADVFYVSGRPTDVADVTKKWITDSGLPQPDNLFISDDKLRDIENLSLDFYVEDNIIAYKSLPKIVRVVFLMNHPWNSDYACPSNVIRINSLIDVL